MTNEEIIKYYADLLILQYHEKPKAFATIEALVAPMVMDQLPIAVQDAFNVDTAEGVQLDVIGIYVGVSRIAYDFVGPIVLNDTDFRTMIKIGIIKNGFGSSLAEIQQLIYQFFQGALLVFDFQTMRMGYFFDSSIGSRPLAEVFVRSQFLPKPMGVELSALIYSNDITSFFGFRTYELPAYNATGFNNYDDYSMDSPWLSYTNAIIP